MSEGRARTARGGGADGRVVGDAGGGDSGDFHGSSEAESDLRGGAGVERRAEGSAVPAAGGGLGGGVRPGGGVAHLPGPVQPGLSDMRAIGLLAIALAIAPVAAGAAVTPDASVPACSPPFANAITGLRERVLADDPGRQQRRPERAPGGFRDAERELLGDGGRQFRARRNLGSVEWHGRTNGLRVPYLASRPLARMLGSRANATETFIVRLTPPQGPTRHRHRHLRFHGHRCGPWRDPVAPAPRLPPPVRRPSSSRSRCCS